MGGVGGPQAAAPSVALITPTSEAAEDRRRWALPDHATGELVEARTYQPYGATESDYRPERWKGFREDYGFTGKEEDIEVGLQYFGKRYLSPYLGRWISADPLAVHVPGRADLNLYAYVEGAVLKSIDPLGLEPNEIRDPDEFVAEGRATAALLKAGWNTLVTGAHMFLSTFAPSFSYEAQDELARSAQVKTTPQAEKVMTALELGALGAGVTKVAVEKGPKLVEKLVKKSDAKLPERLATHPVRGQPKPAPSTITVLDVGDGQFQITSSKGGIFEGKFDPATGELYVDWISVAEKGQGTGTELYRAALKEASSRGTLRSIRGEMEIDNLKELNKAGGGCKRHAKREDESRTRFYQA